MLARQHKRQQRNARVNQNPERVVSFAYFERSPTRANSVNAPKDRPFSPTHPATLRKEKIKKKKEKMTHSSIIENGHHYADKNQKIASENPESALNGNANVTKTRNGKVAPERRASGIPVLVKHNTKVKKKTSVGNGSSSLGGSFLEGRPHTVDTSKPYTIDMDTIKTPAKDRRKWVIPDTPRVDYDHKGSLRLPPLSEIRTASTA